MLISALDKKITFEREVISKTSSGITQKTWEDGPSVWANLYIRAGSMNDFSRSSNPVVSVEWTIWYRDDIDYNTRIKYKSQTYRINFIEEMGNKEGLKIYAEVIKFEGNI
jgi:head-tail adaptor